MDLGCKSFVFEIKCRDSSSMTESCHFLGLYFRLNLFLSYNSKLSGVSLWRAINSQRARLFFRGGICHGNVNLAGYVLVKLAASPSKQSSQEIEKTWFSPQEPLVLQRRNLLRLRTRLEQGCASEVILQGKVWSVPFKIHLMCKTF